MILGLVGFASSGKDTVADYLVRNHNFNRIAFADPLKDAASIIFDWPRHLLEGDTVPSRVFREKPDSYWSEKFDKPFTPRMALQQLGTDACRKVFHNDIWIHLMERKIQQYDNVVVTDVRFPNEIESIVRMGGKILRIKRGEEPEWYNTALKENRTNPDDVWILYDNFQTMDRKYPNVHISEWAWIGHPEVNYIIENKGSLKDLHKSVEKYLQSVRKYDTVEA